MDTGGPRARLTDPITSHEAADSVDIWPSHQAVLDQLEIAGAEGMTQPELIAALPYMSDSRVRSAVGELAAEGKVVFAGFYRMTPRGRRSQVWVLARFEEFEDAA
ncbi:hypothetical protein [Humibacter ginsenosidimutans]|uniref:MarR family transcriptional regulator n=1 Tax=Humibacter ginsenosidimutans TaxID=2599293 RepID=A0A5B8M643_9MICO|nr:hypothetical protein [Humibacter ginsenosidimutans]QDZ15813.1 hypothetical protein FPZ11_14490 [Humibacter ginsenosidimutans]